MFGVCFLPPCCGGGLSQGLMRENPHTLMVLKRNNLKLTEELVVYYIRLSVLCTFEIFPNKFLNM